MYFYGAVKPILYMCVHIYYVQEMQYVNESVSTENSVESIQVYVYRPHRECTALSAQIVLNVGKGEEEGYNISVYDHNQQLITAANVGFSTVSVDYFNPCVPLP